MLASSPETAANTIRDFGSQAVVAIGTIGTIVVATIAAWRKIKAMFEEGQKATETAAVKVADTAVAAARQVATVTATQVKEVREAIEASVGTDGTDTLRSQVAAHGAELKAHAEQAAIFRKEMVGKMDRVENTLELLNTAVVKMLTIKASEARE